MGRALAFRVHGSCDTVLLENDTGDSWLFNDDDSGVDPGIRIQGAREGVYDIRAGTFGPSVCPAQLVLRTSAYQGHGTALQAACHRQAERGIFWDPIDAGVATVILWHISSPGNEKSH